MEPTVLLLLLAALYFLPGLVASHNRHRNAGAIWMCNVLFGWTVVGWGIAMVWACTSNVREPAPQQPRQSLKAKWEAQRNQLWRRER